MASFTTLSSIEAHAPATTADDIWDVPQAKERVPQQNSNNISSFEMTINHDGWPSDRNHPAKAPAPSGKRKQGEFDTEAVLSTPKPMLFPCAFFHRARSRRPRTRDDSFRDHLRKYPQNHDLPSNLRRRVASTADGLSILAGGVATAVILNFNQALGTCPSLEDDHRWPAVLLLPRHLPPPLRCPKWPVYLIAISLYSAAGVFQVMREPRYWTDCALLAVVAAMVTGALYGIRPMVDALVLGGLVSLVCCKGIAWSASACQRD